LIEGAAISEKPRGGAHPAIGYLWGAALALAFYILWTSVALVPSVVGGKPTSPLLRIGVAVLFGIFGFAPALVLMIGPWMAIIHGYKALRNYGAVYFAVSGSCLTFIIACSVASILPKPMFVEDQTFFEGARIAAERQGLCFFLAGLLLGLTHWSISARRRATQGLNG
jgi:hypothetical protein